jgi:anaerobic ribonucleoside-triphosphate reductase activating protein
MNIARIIYPVEVLGPGKRIGIWLRGCRHRCKGCSNPELWNTGPEYELPVEAVFQLVRKISDVNQVDGFTITGGDPLEQSPELAVLITHLIEICEDILLYTGYTMSELRDLKYASVSLILASIVVLIDGGYIEERNNNSPLIGSDNQKIYILNNAYMERYTDYLANVHNQLQNFTTIDGVISVGIHKRGFNEAIKKKLGKV